MFLISFSDMMIITAGIRIELEESIKYEKCMHPQGGSVMQVMTSNLEKTYTQAAQQIWEAITADLSQDSSPLAIATWIWERSHHLCDARFDRSYSKLMKNGLLDATCVSAFVFKQRFFHSLKPLKHWESLAHLTLSQISPQDRLRLLPPMLSKHYLNYVHECFVV